MGSLATGDINQQARRRAGKYLEEGEAAAARAPAAGVEAAVAVV